MGFPIITRNPVCPVSKHAMPRNSNSTRNFVFTWNNPGDAKPVLTPQQRCIAYSLETGELNTPHYQGFVVYKNAVGIKRPLKDFPGCHIEVMRSRLEANISYCSKQSELIVLGNLPITKKDQGTNEKQRWDTIMTLIETSDWQTLRDNYPKEWALHWNKWIAYRMPKPCQETTSGPNYWAYGDPGSGKSCQIRDFCRLHQITYVYKEKSPDWGVFNDHEYMIVNELDCPDEYGKYGDWHPKCLRKWADNGPCNANSKYIPLTQANPRHVYCTSNHSIDEVFPPQYGIHLNAAIHRRFIELKMDRPLSYPPKVWSMTLMKSVDPPPYMWASYGYHPKPFEPRPLPKTPEMFKPKKRKINLDLAAPVASLKYGPDNPDLSCPPLKLVKRKKVDNE